MVVKTRKALGCLTPGLSVHHSGLPGRSLKTNVVEYDINGREKDIHDNVLSEGSPGYKTDKFVGARRCVCKRRQRDLEPRKKKHALGVDGMNSNPALLKPCCVSSGG